jgi:hypothetical protein
MICSSVNSGPRVATRWGNTLNPYAWVSARWMLICPHPCDRDLKPSRRGFSIPGRTPSDIKGLHGPRGSKHRCSYDMGRPLKLDAGGGAGGLGLARRQETGIPKVNGPCGAGIVAPPDKCEIGALQALVHPPCLTAWEFTGGLSCWKIELRHDTNFSQIFASLS